MPTPTVASASAAMPSLIARLSNRIPNASAAAHTSTSTIPVTTSRFAVASIPNSARAQGAPR